jgi:hypothetical protein
VLYDRERVESDARLYGYDSSMACLSFLSLTLWYLGFPEQARRRAEEALALARQLGRPAGITQTMFFTAWVHQLRGDRDISLAQAGELIALSDEHGFPMYSAAGRLLRGELLAGQGTGEEGVALMREGIAGHQTSGILLGASVWEGAWLADGLLRAGATAEAGQAVDDAADRSLELRAAMDMVRVGIPETREELARVYGWFQEGFETEDLAEARRLLETRNA